MNDIRLRRDGQIPLVFDGEQLRTASSRAMYGKEHNRYHTINLYQTEGSRRYILEIIFHSDWQGEAEHHDVLVLGPDDQFGMVKALRTYNPIPDGIGFPRNDNYAQRQADMEQSLRNRFRNLVTTVVDGIEGVEERIE